MVLPYRASCDAMEALIAQNRDEFKNLSQYSIINISGLDDPKQFRTTESVKDAIAKAEQAGEKTITLTVNRMLTGSTVEQWDTMLFLKETSSPQEYDQAIYRLQNQYVRELRTADDRDENEYKVIRECLKPQTILVDFDPTRMFRLQEQRSLFYNVNTHERGNDQLEDRIREELRISPIVTLNANKIHEVQPTDILHAVSNYNANRSVNDEVMDLPVDLAMLTKDEHLRSLIERQAEIGSKDGLDIPPHDGNGEDLGSDDPDGRDEGKNKRSKDKETGKDQDHSGQEDEARTLAKKVQTYYQRILFFAMLAQCEVSSLGDIIEQANFRDHRRILTNLNLNVDDLKLIKKHIDPFKLSQLDYKIQNINRLGRDESLTPIERAQHAIGKFSRLSDSEVRTPAWLCEEMVNQIPEAQLKQAVESGALVLDIASKFGEFALATYQRLVSNFRISEETVRNAIYSIPTSPVAYEFTRRFYEILGLNTDCIATRFTSYDLLKFSTEQSEDCSAIRAALSQPADFKDIDLNSEITSGDQVQFAAVVGNPPYQRQDKGDGSGASPIYPDFLDLSAQLADHVVLIHPARFLFNAGKTSKAWNRRMLNDPHLQVGNYWAVSSDVFDDVDIKGGVAITIRNSTSKIGPIGQYIPDPILRSIVAKVNGKASSSLADLVYPRDLYKLTPLVYSENPYLVGMQAAGHEFDIGSNVFVRLSELFSMSPTVDADAAVVGRDKNGRVTRYLPSRYIRQPDNFLSYRVLVPKTNGTGRLGESLASPFVAAPKTAHTVTFLSIGKFETAGEAEAALKYLKTKFVRILLGSLKVTQDNPRPVWQNIPLQDFTESSPIDWSASIESIDERLFEMYDLDEDECVFIRTTADEMK